MVWAGVEERVYLNSVINKSWGDLKGSWWCSQFKQKNLELSQLTLDVFLSTGL